jgi:MFS family permease
MPAQPEARSGLDDRARPPEASFTITQALRTRSFWLCALSFGLGMATQYAIVVHTIPYLISIGQPESVAGLAVAWLTTSSLVGRLVVGWLADRVAKRHLLAALFALQATGTVVFATMTEPWQIAVFLLLYAPAYGGIIPLRPAILADYFGRRSFGAVQGAISGFTSLAAVVGPVFAGWTFDVTQSYRSAYLVLGIVTAAALPVILGLQKPGPTPTQHAGMANRAAN